MIKFSYINASGKTLIKELPAHKFQSFVDRYAISYDILN